MIVSMDIAKREHFQGYVATLQLARGPLFG
jgi:hypothetical protein